MGMTVEIAEKNGHSGKDRQEKSLVRGLFFPAK